MRLELEHHVVETGVILLLGADHPHGPLVGVLQLEPDPRISGIAQDAGTTLALGVLVAGVMDHDRRAAELDSQPVARTHERCSLVGVVLTSRVTAPIRIDHDQNGRLGQRAQVCDEVSQRGRLV